MSHDVLEPSRISSVNKVLYANIGTDFQNVDHWEENKLDRTQSSRMGWSDVALSLAGPVVQDLRTHFAQRWNFIYFEASQLF